MKLNPKTIARVIKAAMVEDRVHHDITSKIFVDKKQLSQAYIISKEDAIICGNPIVLEIFKKIGAKTKPVAYHHDGENIKKNEPVIFLEGPTSSILSCERIILNFLGHLSGIATLTSAFVKKANNPQTRVLDTRKTTPGLRELEKYAVCCGGGFNHRLDLSDMILIKDNHIAAKGSHFSLIEVLKETRKKTTKTIEIEVDTLGQFKKALKARPDMILLDNMTITQLKKAVQIKKKLHSKIPLEASGGINLNNIARVAKTGVDRISVGQLTHSAVWVDFTMEFVI